MFIADILELLVLPFSCSLLKRGFLSNGACKFGSSWLLIYHSISYFVTLEENSFILSYDVAD